MRITARRLATILASLALAGVALIHPTSAQADVAPLPDPLCEHSDFSQFHGIRYPGGYSGEWDRLVFLGHETTAPQFDPETRRYEGEYSHLNFWRNETHGEEFVVECPGERGR